MKLYEKIKNKKTGVRAIYFCGIKVLTYKKQPKIIQKKLEKHWLEITTVIGCPHICSYCPQKTLLENYRKISSDKILSLDNFKLALSTVPKECEIHFTGYSEPFINPEAIEMLLYAHNQGHRIVVSTTLQYLSCSELKKISHIPFNNFAIHLPDSEGLMKGVQTDNIIEKIKLCKKFNFMNLRGQIFGKLSEDLEKEFEDILLIHSKPILRGGNLIRQELEKYIDCRVQAHDNLKGKKIICSRIKFGEQVKGELDLQNFVLLPNGSLTLCCMDYGLKHILGNLFEQSYIEILNGNEYQRIINIMLQNEDGDLICHECEYALPLIENNSH